jgi:putative hydrolase
VFKAAAKRQVAIEIDGSWDRQDVHFQMAARALDLGCLFALDSDAHANNELAFVDAAIAHARLAGLPEERIVNYWSNERFLAWAAGAWER